MEFDPQCSTERRHDLLMIMDCTGRVIACLSGRDPSDWGPVRVTGTFFIGFNCCMVLNAFLAIAK